MSTLIEAVEAGAIDQARLLLASGVRPDDVGTGGDTALHAAVKAGNAQIAAMLLQRGADWTLRNAEGRTALEPEFAGLETLHRIRQEYQRLAEPPYDCAASPSTAAAAHVGKLERDGILKVSGLLSGTTLAQLQEDFTQRIRKLRLASSVWPGKRYFHYDQEEYWDRKRRSYVTNDALAISPSLLALCCNPIITETANFYLRKRGHIKRAYGMRYLPSKPIRNKQFGWHHDMEDRQLKLMIILTDIGEDDQYMSYIRGSHNAYHPYSRFTTNALDLDYCQTYLDDIEEINSFGQAGDIFFFDSNGMHRGNRSLGRVRDALFIEFTADRNRNNLWGTALPRSHIPQSLSADGGPLGELLDARPKWERRRAGERRNRSSWTDSLEDPSRWL